jgi:predicted ester cyclase
VTGGGPHSLAWFKDVVRQVRAGFPDVRFASEDLIAEGDTVWARWTLQGTHLGEFLGDPPTGKAICVEDCFNSLRVADGRLADDTPPWGCQSGSQRNDYCLTGPER